MVYGVRFMVCSVWFTEISMLYQLFVVDVRLRNSTKQIALQTKIQTGNISIKCI